MEASRGLRDVSADVSVLDVLAAQVAAKGVGADETINPFWQNQLATFGAAFAREGAPTIEALRALGYWELDLPAGERNKHRPDFKAAFDVAKAGDTSVTDKGLLGHAGGLAVLSRNRVLAPYLADMDRLRIASRMSIARLWFYLHRLRRVRTQPGVFLEIGAGGGHFARLAIDAGMVSHYVTLDLPEMLLNSAATLAHKVPEAVVHAGGPLDLSAAGLHLWFLRPDQAGEIPSRSIDYAINFNSFMEMDRDVRDGYFDLIYRTARRGAVFYNVNRMQRAMTMRDGSTYENNPLLYPYRPSDTVVEWCTDEMQDSNRARAFNAPWKSFCISRIGILE